MIDYELNYDDAANQNVCMKKRTRRIPPKKAA